jgi:hypothetical protein
VWLIILSDQLPIVGLVGRYPTNYLIGRGPLPWRSIFPPQGSYGISSSFPELFRTTGQVPTRYSPVRHSPEGAFDLHVLGMPPAFVLSQDQTLRLKPGPRGRAPDPSSGPVVLILTGIRPPRRARCRLAWMRHRRSKCQDPPGPALQAAACASLLDLVHAVKDPADTRRPGAASPGPADPSTARTGAFPEGRRAVRRCRPARREPLYRPPRRACKAVFFHRL